MDHHIYSELCIGNVSLGQNELAWFMRKTDDSSINDVMKGKNSGVIKKPGYCSKLFIYQLIMFAQWNTVSITT